MSTGVRESWRIVALSVSAGLLQDVEKELNAQGHRLVGILTAPGPRTRRTDGYREIAELARPGLDVIISNYPSRWETMIRPLRPDLIVVVSFNWIIPPSVLAVPRLGTINGHDGLLPRYRGLNAIGWALRNDESESGITVHYVTAGLDDGPVLAQRAIPITDDDDWDTLIGLFVETEREAFQEAFERIALGDPGTPQDEADAYTTPGLFEDDWLYIDWTKPARDVFVQIRSWHGTRDQPRGALGEIDGVLTRITKAKLVGENRFEPAPPGTVLSRGEDSMLIQCGDGPLRILQWQPEPSSEAS
ncbi:N/A [soil metagenome]